MNNDLEAIGLTFPEEVPEPEIPVFWEERLSGVGVLATLEVVVGNLSLEDAANAVSLPPEALVAEAEAWEYAAAVSEDDASQVS